MMQCWSPEMVQNGYAGPVRGCLLSGINRKWRGRGSNSVHDPNWKSSRSPLQGRRARFLSGPLEDIRSLVWTWRSAARLLPVYSNDRIVDFGQEFAEYL